MLRSLINWVKSIAPNGFYFIANKNQTGNNLKSNGSNKTKFFLNDPSTPEFILEQNVPTRLALPMNVTGDKGGGFPLGSIQQQASACKIVLNNSLSYMMACCTVANLSKKITRWAATSNLIIRPRAGVDINAYYDRASLSFFYFNNKVKRKVVYTCDSQSVVTHEFGHAFLDILRPDFWSAQAPEVWAYHEAFGDMVALISCLQYDDLINAAWRETEGDLLKSNIISRLASEMGMGLYDLSKDKSGLLNNCLRDMSIKFDYVYPESLPLNGLDSILTNECHSFSRVFSGAFYELFVKFSNKNIELGRSPLDAMKISRDVLSRYLIKATAAVPMTNRLFDAMAKQMLIVDKSEGSKYQSILEEVFKNRKILISKVLMLKDADFSEVKKTIKNPYELYLYNKDKYIKTHSTKFIKLKDLVEISALNDNPLFKLELEVPSETGYYFDENNKLFDMVETTEDEIVESALVCVDYLHRNNLVGKHKNALFEVKGNKLVRKRIVCKCGLPNYCDPNAPEYGKPWKPANHSSCCVCQGPNCKPRSCDCSQPEKPAPRKTSCFTAIKSCYGSAYKIGQSLTRGFCSN